jgi:hypothetical protein
MIKCPDPSEYPMRPECKRYALVLKAYKLDPMKAAELSAAFFAEVYMAEQNFINGLKDIIPESDWNMSK